MSFKRFTLLLVFVISFSSCVEDTKVAFSEIQMTTPENTIVEINVPKAHGDKAVAKKINTTVENAIKTFLKIGDLEIEPNQTVDDYINAFNKEYLSFKSDFPDSPMEWDAQIDGEVMYHSESVISIALTNYQNTGGAHGILAISFLNFDVLTGEKLENKDLFTDFEAFTKLAKTYYLKEIEDQEDLYFEPHNFSLPANIGFDDEGLFLLYNTYEIAPYSTGLTEIHIPYEEVSMLLNYM